METKALPSEAEMQDAFFNRDVRYDGLFYVAVQSTGIFCRPTCPARRPRPDRVAFFPSPGEALAAGYRPCRRCHPLENAGAAPDWLDRLLELVDSEPSERWTDQDIRDLDIDPQRVRRWFQSNHGVTFHAYLRARRLGLALSRIREGDDPTGVGFDHGYESLSGFRAAFQQIVGDTPGRSRERVPVMTTRLETPLGPMLAAAVEEGLCLLEFCDRKSLEKQIQRLRGHLNCVVVPGSLPVLERAAEQLKAYFQGRLTRFDLPLITPGTPFEQEVWRGLQQIPYGQTSSYGEQARLMGRPQAVRAVARANAANRIAVVIPCHRVIGADGRLCGYAGGLWRKQKLLELERDGC